MTPERIARHVPVTINSNVYFRLTDAGRQAMERGDFALPPPDETGRYRLYLWDVMAALGPHMRCGPSSTIICDIEIERDPDQSVDSTERSDTQ